MATLAELRAAKPGPKALPTRVVRVCLDHSVLAAIGRLRDERQDVLIAALDTEQAQKPRKMSEGTSPTPARVAEIDAELEVLYAKMRAAEGEILLRAIEGGAWLRWKDAHPPREDNETDVRITYSVCNATALVGELGQFAKEWNGEPLAESDWPTVFAPQVAPADLLDLCKKVVELHEVSVSVPKSPAPSLPTPSGEPA